MSLLERLWKDQGDVYRVENIVDGSISRPIERMVASSVKCQYSQCSVSTTEDANGAPTIENSHKLFCAVNAAITEGDRVVVTRGDQSTVSLIIGEGFNYPTHKEYKVKRSDTL